jgi:hypothetical protein
MKIARRSLLVATAVGGLVATVVDVTTGSIYGVGGPASAVLWPFGIAGLRDGSRARTLMF